MADGKGRQRVAVQAVNCPNCGATTAVRTFGHAVNVVCQSCHSILDAKDPGVTILQKFKEAMVVEPLIPLGTKGTIPGSPHPFEAVGFQVRQIVVDGVAYQWREYLLFNPYYGFRYLTEYGGHWNVAATLRSLPDGDRMPGNSGVRTYRGEDYRHFQTAIATTVFVLGEFPWQVRVGDRVVVVDYVAPPQLLSAEVTEDQEVNWSLGQYTTGTDIWRGLSVPGRPPSVEGVFANQPSPYYGVPGKLWRQAALLMALAALVWFAHIATARRQQAFRQALVYNPRSTQDASLVTSVFELDGRPSAVEVDTASNLANQWMDVGYALINSETGQTYEFGEALSFYNGVEAGEAWTEGSPAASFTLPSVPAGRYFLRVEPEAERTGKPVSYTVTVVRDVATSIWFLGAVILIVLPPLLTSFRAAAFERRRWQESDHSTGKSSDNDKEDDEKDDGDE